MVSVGKLRCFPSKQVTEYPVLEGRRPARQRSAPLESTTLQKLSSPFLPVFGAASADVPSSPARGRREAAATNTPASVSPPPSPHSYIVTFSFPPTLLPRVGTAERERGEKGRGRGVSRPYAHCLRGVPALRTRSIVTPT